MNSALIFVLFFVAVVVVANVLAAKRKQKRAESAQHFAALQGFRAEGDVNPFLGLEINRPQVEGSDVGPVRVGIAPVVPQMLVELAAGRGTIQNVLRGSTAAGETILFDYKPSAAGTSSDFGGNFSTVASFPVPGIIEFQIFPQARFSFGIKDIDFPSHPGFSKRFTLMANDEAAIRRLFTSPVLEAFEALPDREWHIQAGSGWLFMGRALFSTERSEDLPEIVAGSSRVAAALQAAAS